AGRAARPPPPPPPAATTTGSSRRRATPATSRPSPPRTGATRSAATSTAWAARSSPTSTASAATAPPRPRSWPPSSTASSLRLASAGPCPATKDWSPRGCDDDHPHRAHRGGRGSRPRRLRGVPRLHLHGLREPAPARAPDRHHRAGQGDHRAGGAGAGLELHPGPAAVPLRLHRRRAPALPVLHRDRRVAAL